jgi:hypothetical protein
MRTVALRTIVLISVAGVVMLGCDSPASTGNPKVTHPAAGPSAPTSTVNSSRPSTLSSTTATTTAASVVSTRCNPAQLSPSLSDQMGGAGHGWTTVTLTNISSSTCTVYGFPGLGFRTATGQSVPLSVSRQAAKGWRYPAIPESSVTLSPDGGAASFGMEWINGPTSGTYSLQVTPPNDAGYLVVPDQTDDFSNNRVSVTPVTTLAQLGTE